QALLQAAADGRLVSSEDLDREFDRLVRSEAGKKNLGHFLEGWLEVEDLPGRAKDETQVQFPIELRQEMLEETRLLFLDVFESGGGVPELFRTDHTFLTQRLRQYYQLWGDAPETHVRAELEGRRARGLLAHGSVLSRHALAFSSSPVMRGFLVRERLLCEELPAPPAGVDTNITPPDGAPQTTRERYIEHSQNSACNGCHQLMDPIGFAFEHYDGFGRYRDQENGLPIDATGTVIRGSDGDVALDGLDSLSEFLAESEQVSACFERYLSYYAYGIDDCSTEAIASGAMAGGRSLEAVLRATVQAPHFRFRRE
ncbi:MAG: DUF1588 domain-containing protein, partial [Myxococcota bacterium]